MKYHFNAWFLCSRKPEWWYTYQLLLFRFMLLQNRSSCEMGCGVFRELDQTSKFAHFSQTMTKHAVTMNCHLWSSFLSPEGEFPPSPPREPTLIELPVHTYGAWRYRVDPGNTSLAFLPKESGELHITSFLFRVHQTDQDILTLYWLVRKSPATGENNVCDIWKASQQLSLGVWLCMTKRGRYSLGS